jgi:hypothetical protein
MDTQIFTPKVIEHQETAYFLKVKKSIEPINQYLTEVMLLKKYWTE